MKKLIVSVLVLALVLAPAIPSFALNAPMSGVDMQGFYNAAGYIPGGQVVWPTNMVQKAGYNAGQNVNGISKQKQSTTCIPILFACIDYTQTSQSNYQMQRMGGTYTGYETSGWGGWYGTGSYWGVSSWVSDLVTGNLGGFWNNLASNIEAAAIAGDVGGILGIGAGLGLTTGLGGSGLLWGSGSSWGSGGPSYISGVDTQVGGLDWLQNLGAQGGPAYPGWTSRTGFGQVDNSQTVPSNYCNAGNC